MYNKKFKFLSLIFLATSILFLNINAFAYQPETKSKEASCHPNDKASISFIIDGNESKIIPEPFKCEVKFDSNNLKYSKINCIGNIKRTDIKVEKNEGYLNIFYNPKKPREIILKDDKSEMFEVMFTVKNKVLSGTTTIHTDFKNIGCESLICSSDSNLNIIGNPGMGNCKLKSLSSAQGDVSPEFSPDVFDYAMEVPAEIQNVEFSAQPMSENLSVKISRRKLAAPDKITNVKITVSDKSLRIKSIYNIQIKRSPKDNLKEPKESKKKETSPSKAKNKNKNINKKSKKPSKYDCTEVNSQNCSDELETENTESINAPSTISFKNNSFRVYCIVIFCLLLSATATYFIIKFVKYRKNLSEKSNNSLNNDLKK